MKAFDLSQEIALISGGGTGIGKAIAQCMIEAGARVVIVGRRESEIEQTRAELGDRAFCFRYDVTAVEQAPELVRQIREKVGAPTILVNNAGIHQKKLAVETTEQDIELLMQTHVLGAMALTRAVLPGMLERRAGSILFVTSMAAVFGIPHVLAYTAAKSALLGMVRALAVEVSPSGVRVNAIAPGWIETDITRKAVGEERRQKIIGRTPAGQFGQPEDIGWAAVYLSSPAARFVTGTQLVVDGGASIGF